MSTIDRKAYADMFGPTVGDRLRLGDTELWIEVEEDKTIYGEEVKFGGGNTFSYSLSKHINEFIPGYIRKLCSKNILYNTLRIGVTDTKLHNKIKNKSLTQRIKLIPMKKKATTDDIAEYIFYLIVHNNFIANELINITGGE